MHGRCIQRSEIVRIVDNEGIAQLDRDHILIVDTERGEILVDFRSILAGDRRGKLRLGQNGAAGGRGAVNCSTLHAARGFQELRLEDELAEVFNFGIGTESVRRGIHRRQDGPGLRRRRDPFHQYPVCIRIEPGFRLSKHNGVSQQITAQRTGCGKKDGRHKCDDYALDKGTHE